MSTTTTNQDGSGSKLKQAITGPLLFLFILGDVLGAGIYALMGTLSKDVGGALWAPLVLALLLALLTAGSYAELVTKYPKAGGAAVFAERAYKTPIVSFLVGFSMLAAGVTSAAGSRWRSRATTSARSWTCRRCRRRSCSSRSSPA